jgi:ribosome-binding protein aMBF1 (putative translation factor)
MSDAGAIQTPVGIANAVPPSSYEELAELVENLGFLIREKRRRTKLSLRAAANQMNLNISTLSRIENGVNGFSSDSIVVVLRWLAS